MEISTENRIDHTAIAEPQDLWNAPTGIIDLLEILAPRIFRKDISQPGYAIIDLGLQLDPAKFRSILIGFYSALDGYYLRHFSRRTLLRSVGRFDQKVTTEPHLDGAPDESILLLGYEPTPMQSRLSLIDFTRCAGEQGITPIEFLERHHLASPGVQKMLEPYATDATPFEAAHYRIAIINNSRLPVSAGAAGMLGVLHKSTVVAPQPGESRFISTLLISPGEPRADDLIAADAIRGYIDSGKFAMAQA